MAKKVSKKTAKKADKRGKTATLVVHFKDPDGLHELRNDLNLSDALARTYLEFGEYASVMLTVNDRMQIIHGEFLGR